MSVELFAELDELGSSGWSIILVLHVDVIHLLEEVEVIFHLGINSRRASLLAITILFKRNH